MGRLAITLISLAGCHKIFALEDRKIDAALAVDTAGDGMVIVDAPRGDSTTLGDGRICWDPAMIADDEDGDLVMDGCDNCPGVPNAGQENADGDDLGDPCDPSGVTREHIVLWHNFNHGIDSGWNEPITPWEPTGDGYSQPSDVVVGSIAVFAARTFTNATIEARITQIRDIQGPTIVTAGVYVWTEDSQPDLAEPDGLLCHEMRRDGTDSVQILERGPGGSVKDGNISGERTGVTYLRFSTKHGGTANQVECAGGRNYVTPIRTQSDEPARTGYVALTTGNTAATFQSVLVSEQDP